MKGLFFDASATMLAKNLLPIANVFCERIPDFKALFVSAEISSNVNPVLNKDSYNKIVSNEKYNFIRKRSFNARKIENFLTQYNPDFIFIGAYRIYDQLWTGIAKKKGIKVYKIQHGFEVESVYYKPFTILSKAIKSVRLIYAAYNLAVISGTAPLKLINQYQKYIIKGISLKDTLLNNKLFHPTLSFVYSEYYKDFWNKKFGFDKDQMSIITPQDFLLIKKVSEKPKEDACCYITQTIVEDGRMKEKDFVRMLEEYVEIAKSVNKFIIKLHPRANIKYYDAFERLSNVEITRDFPNCTCYLTHYSSMIFTAAFFSDNLIIHETKGNPTPDLFKSVASHIVTKPSEILIAIEENTDKPVPSLDERKEFLKDYACFEDKNPYEKIFEEIIKQF